MQRAGLFSLLAGCTALVLGFAVLGCGGSSDTRQQQELLDLAALAGVCTDTCNTITSCVPWFSQAEQDELLDECQQHCSDPADEDVETRDCVIDCELSLSCEDYFDCLCGCGMDGLCL